MRRFGCSGSSDSRSSGGAVQVRLEDGADVVVAGLAQAAVDPQREVDERRVLHVDTDEVPEAPGFGDEPLDVRVAELLVERGARGASA